MTKKSLLFKALCFLLLTGCVAPIPKKDYTKFRTEDPKSILIVPVVNRSVDVDAPDYFLSTATLPIAERGYYIFPVNLVKRLLEDDGLSDADLVHSADPTRVAELFGADSVLYIAIKRWDAKYVFLSTTVTVEFSYSLRSGKTGETLWEDSETMFYSPQQQQSSGNPFADLIAMALSAAIIKAAPNYVPLARQANANAFTRPYQGLPAGPYHKKYNQDMDQYIARGYDQKANFPLKKEVTWEQLRGDQVDGLNSFLRLYCQTFESKDIDKFATFFAPDALENNKPFHEVLPQYRKNAELIESFKYNIELTDYSQSAETGNIKVKGKYFIKYFLHGETCKENNGNISMEFARNGDSYLVKRLYYTSQSAKTVENQPKWGPWIEIKDKKEQ